MREWVRKVIPEQVVPERVIEEYTVHCMEYRCDGCGREISREDNGDGYAHELQVGLDTEECVSFFRERDYCPACLEPVWTAINQLIGADPAAPGRDKDYVRLPPYRYRRGAEPVLRGHLEDGEGTPHG